MIRAAVLAVALALPAQAQQVDWQVLGEALRDTRPDGPQMSSGSESVLRVLDKMSGAVEDLRLAVGASVTYGRLSVDLSACRFPAENPASDAFAYLRITDLQSREMVFQGWMIAASPALNALDHPRYDVWVLSCS